MKKQKRITAPLGESTIKFLEKITAQENLSDSEIIRRTLNSYNENRAFPKEKVATCMDLLLNGEHVLMDIENWFLFLDFIESSQTRKYSGRSNRGIARSNGEQLKNQVVTVENLLKRLEVCNFFKVIKISENNFTLILRSELTKKFIMIFLEEYLLRWGKS